MTLILRSGGVVVGTQSGELVLLEADVVRSHLNLGGYSVFSALETEEKLYVGTWQKVVVVDLKTFSLVLEIETESWVFSIQNWKGDYLLLGKS